MTVFILDTTVFTKQELAAIFTGLKSLDSVSRSASGETLARKIGGSQAVSLDDHMAIDLASHYQEPLTEKIAAIRAAIRDRLPLSFDYYYEKGQCRWVVEPYKLVFRWSAWYVWGWCTLRRDFRLFKLNRMVALRTGEPFKKRTAPPPDFSQKNIYPSLYQVKAIIQPQFRWRLVDEFGPESFVQQPDGSLLFTHGFADKNAIICWLISFGKDAELIEPAELRQDILAFAEAIQQNYSLT